MAGSAAAVTWTNYHGATPARMTETMIHLSDFLVALLTDIKRAKDSMTRIDALAKRCRKRGGDCQCKGDCQAIEAIQNRVADLRIKQREFQREIDHIETITKRLTTAPATLKDKFRFHPDLKPVMVFIGEEATFGYEDAEGWWCDCDEWPFNETDVFFDDCERYDIRVECA